MCNFPSWIEEDSGKVWFLVDADVVALIETHGGIWEDYIGHTPLKKYFGAEGRSCEATSIHPTILTAIADGKMKRMAKAAGYDVVAIAGKFKAKEDQKVLALGWSKVIAMDNSEVTATGNSKVIAWNHSKVIAWDNSEVDAQDNSKVDAWGNSKVITMSNSEVDARDNSEVIARDNSEVIARGNSKVDARDHSKVNVWDNSEVIARDNSEVINHRIKKENRIMLNTGVKDKILLTVDRLKRCLIGCSVCHETETRETISALQAIVKEEYGNVFSNTDGKKISI